MDERLLAAPILIPLATAFFVPVVRRISHTVRAIFCLVAMLLTLACLLLIAREVFDGGIVVYWMGGWEPREGLAIGISLVADAWGVLVALVVAVIGLMALLYSTVYMGAQSGRGSYYVLVMLLLTGLIGFCLSGDLFNQFVWLEEFSFAGFALTGFHIDDRQAVEAAFKYLITNSVAAFFIAIGLTLLYMQTGALNLAQIAAAFSPTPSGLVALGLLLGGYATKAALVPWHFWLPDAHAVAPAPISALFSGALIKVGIYAIARSIFTLVPLEPGGIMQTGLLLAAAATMLLGGIQMMQQQSIKRILAFSSVSQMGYVVMGLALGTPLGAAAAAFHVISHALLKSALFMSAGMITWRSGIHNLKEGGGLARRMPFTFVLMVIAGLGLSGQPFLSGFVSKTMLEEAAFATRADWIGWVAVIASLFTFAGLARLIWGIFGPVRSAQPPLSVREAPFLALLPGLLLVAGSLFVGTQPEWVNEQLSWPAAAALFNRREYISTVIHVEASSILDMAHLDVHEVPHPLDTHHWPIPAVILLGGILLTTSLLQPEHLRAYQRYLRPIHSIARWSRLWHTGLVMDYVMWNAFGTALAAFITVLAGRVG